MTGAPALDLLIVDDEPALRQALSRVLTIHGYRVVVARNGVDALEKLVPGRRLPACIVTDLEMPVMGGLKFLRALQENPRLAPIPTIILSGSLNDLEIPLGTMSLSKPVDLKALLCSITALTASAVRSTDLHGQSDQPSGL